MRGLRNQEQRAPGNRKCNQRRPLQAKPGDQRPSDQAETKTAQEKQELDLTELSQGTAELASKYWKARRKKVVNRAVAHAQGNHEPEHLVLPKRPDLLLGLWHLRLQLDFRSCYSRKSPACRQSTLQQPWIGTMQRRRTKVNANNSK